MHDLLDRSIETKGVVDIFQSMGIPKQDISILDDEFLEQFKTHHEHKNLRLKLLEKLLHDEIVYRERRNVAKYRSFRSKLEETLRKYHNRAIQAADVIRAMIEIRKDIENEDQRTKELGLSSEELAFYDAIAANAENLYDKELLCDVVRETVKTLKRRLRVDWTKPHREAVKSEVRSAVKMILRRKGIGKEHLDFLLNGIMTQAEASYADWPLAA